MELRSLRERERRLMEEVAEEYRSMWRSLRPPFECAFIGKRDDVDALDFVGYEAGHHPRGLLGAAFIWGNVFVQTGLVHWFVNEEGQFFFGSIEYPRLLICPYARTVEIEHSMHPQFDKYQWLAQQTVATCLAQGEFTEEEQAILIGLTETRAGEGFTHYMAQAIRRIERTVKPA